MYNTFLKNLGVDDDTINALEGIENEEQVQELSQKVLNNLFIVAREQEDYKQAQKKEVDGMIIGKEKSLKKSFARSLGLTLTSSEAEIMSIDDIAKMAKETLSTSKDENDRINNLLEANNKLTDEIERLKASHSTEIESLISKAKKEANKAIISQELISLLPKVLNVTAKNVSVAADTLKAIALGKGYEIDVDQKNDLKLYKDGKDVIVNNKIYSVKDFAKDELAQFFENAMTGGNERKVEIKKQTLNMSLAEQIKAHNAKHGVVLG